MTDMMTMLRFLLEILHMGSAVSEQIKFQCLKELMLRITGKKNQKMTPQHAPKILTKHQAP